MKEETKKAYVTPQMEVVVLAQKEQLLSQSVIDVL